MSRVKIGDVVGIHIDCSTNIIERISVLRARGPHSHYEATVQIPLDDYMREWQLRLVQDIMDKNRINYLIALIIGEVEHVRIP